MKKSPVAKMIAVSLIALPSIAFSAELPRDEPMMLTANQMDSITAGRYKGDTPAPGSWLARNSFFNLTAITQEIYAPVTIVQIGNNNTAVVFSIPGNYSTNFR